MDIANELTNPRPKLNLEKYDQIREEWRSRDKVVCSRQIDFIATGVWHNQMKH